MDTAHSLVDFDRMPPGVPPEGGARGSDDFRCSGAR